MGAVSSSYSPPITFGGINSQLPVNDIITQLMAIESQPLQRLQQQKTNLTAQDTQYQTLSGKVTKLQTSINTLIGNSLLNQDVFSNKSTTSGNTAIVTATAGITATPQTLQLQVISLASATQANSASQIGAVATASTTLSGIANGTVTSGTFTLNVNGTATSINVNPAGGNTIDSVLSQIRGVAGITGATVDGAGKVVLSFNLGTTVRLGATGDTSNFLTATHLDTGINSGTAITSSNLLSTINLNGSIEDNTQANLQTAVTAGSTFQIGGATFSTAGQTLGGLINQINSSSTAGVTVNYNASTNKLQMISKQTGNTLINLKDTNGNFLQAMGLVTAGGDMTASQTLGNNAQFMVNSSTLYSASNTVSSTVSGITGVTLNLVSASVGTNVNITVQQDSTALKQAINDFITNLNDVNAFIKTQTDPLSSTAAMKDQMGVKFFRNSLINTTTSQITGTSPYVSLQDIGISTGTGSSVSQVFSLDSSKLDAALASNPAQVKALMVGTTGAITQLKTTVDQSLNADPTAGGLFSLHTTTYQAKLQSLNNTIQRTQDRLSRKQLQFQQEFAVMEQLISQSQSQGNALNNLTAQLTMAH